MKKIERALLSVSDKAGLVEFAQGLAAHGVALLSTGGTSKALRDAGLEVTDVSDFTGFPEMLEGRVKTLHPKVHGGLLYKRGDAEHEATIKEHGIDSIDLVCVNLYPFEATVAKADVTFEEAIENIDIGGPSMLRSAAKNMKAVTVVTEPSDYEAVLASMKANDGDTDEALRMQLGLKVFARVAEYNAAIAGYLASQVPEASTPPLVIAMTDGEVLRYGENPHQKAVFYTDPSATEACISHTEQLHGKAMSFNNYVDGNGALEAVKELSGTPGISIIKHTNPCGYATGSTLREALEAAWAGDPVSAFGSVIASTVTVDLHAAEFLKGKFVEVLIAPDFDADAQKFLEEKSKGLRLLKLKHPMAVAGKGLDLKPVNGGILVQDRDIEVNAKWEVVTSTPFPEAYVPLAEFGVKVCKHVKSNAILLVREYKPGCYMVLGMGAGQPNRVDAVRKLAVTKARENIALIYEETKPEGVSLEDYSAQILGECVLISDAFFPFPDNIEIAAAAGIKYVVEPGGSVKDGDVIAAAEEHGIALAMTGLRHFKH